MMRYGLPLLLASVSASAQEPAALDCTGPFARTADEAALVARFGRADVAAATLDGAEGATERGAAIFPNDPSRRIEIFWHDTVRRRRPASIVVRGRSTWTVRVPGGGTGAIALGTAIDAVEAANGRPFLLNGFAWDMGGYASGWKGGRFEAAKGGCSVSVRFDPDPRARGRALDKVSGDERFGSSNPAVRAVRPRVSEISLGWPE